MVTRIDIINRALTNIGIDPLANEEAEGAETPVNAYEAVLDLQLSMYPWSFNRQLRQLSAREEPPGSGWLYRFPLPSDRVGQPSAIYVDKADIDRDNQLKVFAYDGDNELLADVPVVWVRYPGKPAPVRWPGYFRACVQLGIEAECAVSIREDKGLADRKKQELYGTPSQGLDGGLFGAAQVRDAQSTPAQELESEAGDLIAARR